MTGAAPPRTARNSCQGLGVALHCAVGAAPAIAGCNGNPCLNTSSPGIAEEPALPVLQQIATALTEHGWGVFTDALPPGLPEALAVRAQDLSGYRTAGVGRASAAQINRFVRRDEIAWIAGSGAAEAAWLTWTEALRVHLNRTLLLGLDEFESHFARYRSGSFYRRHLDAFSDQPSRVISLVTYLNPDWVPGDGGELVLYGPDLTELGRFPPTLGTLIVYLSDTYPHEVLPATRLRFSVAAWFRRRPDLPVDARAH